MKDSVGKEKFFSLNFLWRGANSIQLAKCTHHEGEKLGGKIIGTNFGDAFWSGLKMLGLIGGDTRVCCNLFNIFSVNETEKSFRRRVSSHENLAGSTTTFYGLRNFSSVAKRRFYLRQYFRAPSFLYQNHAATSDQEAQTQTIKPFE